MVREHRRNRGLCLILSTPIFQQMILQLLLGTYYVCLPSLKQNIYVANQQEFRYATDCWECTRYESKHCNLLRWELFSKKRQKILQLEPPLYQCWLTNGINSSKFRALTPQLRWIRLATCQNRWHIRSPNTIWLRSVLVSLHIFVRSCKLPETQIFRVGCRIPEYHQWRQ